MLGFGTGIISIFLYVIYLVSQDNQSYYIISLMASLMSPFAMLHYLSSNERNQYSDAVTGVAIGVFAYLVGVKIGFFIPDVVFPCVLLHLFVRKHIINIFIPVLSSGFFYIVIVLLLYAFSPEFLSYTKDQYEVQFDEIVALLSTNDTLPLPMSYIALIKSEHNEILNLLVATHPAMKAAGEILVIYFVGKIFLRSFIIKQTYGIAPSKEQQEILDKILNPKGAEDIPQTNPDAPNKKGLTEFEVQNARYLSQYSDPYLTIPDYCIWLVILCWGFIMGIYLLPELSDFVGSQPLYLYILINAVIVVVVMYFLAGYEIAQNMMNYYQISLIARLFGFAIILIFFPVAILLIMLILGLVSPWLPPYFKK